MSDARAIIGVIAIGAIALSGLLVAGSLLDTSATPGLADSTEEIVGPNVSETYEFDAEEPERFEIQATQEVGVDPGGDGHISVDDGGAFGSGNWTVFSTAALNGSANGTYTIAAYDDETFLLEYSDGQYRAIYYTGGQSAVATVPATTPETLTPVGVSWDGTSSELTIAAEGQSDTATPTDTAPDRTVAFAWDGTLDELRVLDTTNDVATSPYLNEPVSPLEGTDHTVRLMLDEESDTVTNYYGTDGTVTGGVFVEGVANPDLVEGEDYETGTNPASVTFLAGGFFDGAPIAYVTIEGGGVVADEITGILTTFDLMGQIIPIAMIILMTTVLIGVMQRTR